MTSRKVEDIHQEMLDRLLSASGLVCRRTPLVSSESTVSFGSAEEAGPVEEEEEAAPEVVEEETTKSVVEEEVHESLPEIFPPPSLRHVLPDSVREIEKQNRIHVLPEEFRTDIDPQAIPKIATTPQKKYIEVLADMLGCKRFRSSLAEFWFLDTLANLLRRAQEEELERSTQAVLMLWFCEWMKEMQHFDAADRQRMMKRFQDNMLRAVKYIVESKHLPTPVQAGVYYKAQEDFESDAGSSKPPPKVNVHYGEGTFECCLRDLSKIIHYIFDLFSTDYQYDLVRSVFTFTPDYCLIDAPYQIQNPKRLYAPLKTKPKKSERSPKKDKPVKGKKKEVDTAEYIALMELKAKDEKLVGEQEERDREQWNLRSHILPLNLAATEEFFNQYWPPPPPEPEPEPTSDTKSKGKGKK